MNVRTTQVPVVTISFGIQKTAHARATSFTRIAGVANISLVVWRAPVPARSAKTRTWAIAEKVRRKVEDQFDAADPARPGGSVAVEATSRNDIAGAVQLFLSDKRSQGLDRDVLKKYERELDRFSEFMIGRSRFFPHEVSLQDITEFRSDWTEQYPSSTTRAKVQERLRAFLRYCYESKMIDRVPVLSPIKVDEAPTLPLTEQQYHRLLEVIPGEFSPQKAVRVHALVCLIGIPGWRSGMLSRLSVMNFRETPP